ncbi:hypothetical protein [Actinoplanes regularis]|uniref:Uncharacterized protein n=1 Tax=Actinoplanes regularis TaxID=52697 RepID=A0A239FSC5_9ACTN|nr:hypothetical protein [Actinoplanes regularis]GIE90160.1 hypothetical protein Are01nite_66400 [Actinoplanes regularis]SNS59685.1 hypothetical protein SAMN06264365_11926 [Actinoplanes regularis]
MPFHAYGPSVDDEALLDALRRGDDRPQELDEPFWRAPYSFLTSALYCGGRLTPATVEGMRFFIRTIGEPGFGGDDPTLRHAALWFLREVAGVALAGFDRAAASRRNEPEVRAWLAAYLLVPRSILEWTAADSPGQVLLAAARTDCFDLLPEAFAAVEPLLAASSPRLRLHAASAAAMLSHHPDLVVHRPRLLEYHVAECASDDPYHRASMLLGVGELDGAPRAWLRDPHPGVRVCAALAPALADDPEATAVLLAEVTRNPAVLDMQAFEGMMALTALPHAAAVLAEQLCRRIGDVDRLVPAAVASVPYGATRLSVGEEQLLEAVLCEPYLRAVFPDGLPSPAALTAGQRRFAAAIAQHDPVWQRDALAEPPQDRYVASRRALAWEATFARLALPDDRTSWQAAAGLLQ